MKKIKVAKQDIGRKVVYLPSYKYSSGVEEGVITSFNDSFVFVRYGADTHSKATNYFDLKYV